MLQTIRKTCFVNYDIRAMCTAIEQAKEVREQKYIYMKNRASNIDTDTRPADWDTAKPFSAIPGPKPVPIFGNLWRYFPVVGNLYGMDHLHQHDMFNKTYGDIVKLGGLKVRKDMVILFNTEDIETAYRNEGVWPQRVSLESFVYYKNLRNDVFQGVAGVLAEQGEGWYKTRSVVNPPMMQPRNAQMYVESMDGVAGDFINRMSILAAKNPHGEMPEDFLRDINRWALESICLVGLNKRLGLLESKPNAEGEQFISDVLEMFDYLNDFDVKPSLWKWITTPKFRKYIKVLDRITAFELKHLDQAVKIMENRKEEIPDNELSILEKLIRKDKKVALAMSFDMLIAGIDTTSRITSAALYYLATNPVAQERLRQETKKFLPNKDSPITNDMLNQMSYLRAVIKETARLAPIAIGNFRQTSKDLVLSGYQIPKGSDILMGHMLLCRKDEHFKDPHKFIPERWLRGTHSEYVNKDLNPWVYMPFGFGPRSCIGKRIANLEIEIVLIKILRNFKIDWPHEEMKWIMEMLYGVGSPLKFHISPVKS